MAANLGVCVLCGAPRVVVPCPGDHPADAAGTLFACAVLHVGCGRQCDAPAPSVAATPLVWPTDAADGLRRELATLRAQVADHLTECQRSRDGYAAMHRRAQRAEVCAARALREGLAACDDLRRLLERALTSPTARERAEVYGLLASADREYQALRRGEAPSLRACARLSAELTAARTLADRALDVCRAYEERDNTAFVHDSAGPRVAAAEARLAQAWAVLAVLVTPTTGGE